MLFCTKKHIFDILVNFEKGLCKYNVYHKALIPFYIVRLNCSNSKKLCLTQQKDNKVLCNLNLLYKKQSLNVPL